MTEIEPAHRIAHLEAELAEVTKRNEDLERRLRSEVVPEGGDTVFGVSAAEFLAFRSGLRKTNAQDLFKDLADLRYGMLALAAHFDSAPYVYPAEAGELMRRLVDKPLPVIIDISKFACGGFA